MREDVRLNIEKAVELARSGLTYEQVALAMNRPNGTINRWLAPFKIPRDPKLKKAQAIKASSKMQDNYKILREIAYEKAFKDSEESLKYGLLRDFINIYIGEGNKRDACRVSIVNSDPKIIYLSVNILKRFFLNEGKIINLQVRYYKENDNEKELLEYWQKLLKYDEKIKFTTYVQPTVKANNHNNSNKFGLVILTINDTYAKEKLNAYMDYIKAEWIKSFEENFDTRIDKKLLEVVKVKTEEIF